jgi:hypothetical protein
MKKCRNKNGRGNIPDQNPVVKYAHQFNKAHLFKDKSKYARKAKHSKQEVFPIARSVTLEKPPVFAYVNVLSL